MIYWMVRWNEVTLYDADLRESCRWCGTRLAGRTCWNSKVVCGCFRALCILTFQRIPAPPRKTPSLADWKIRYDPSQHGNVPALSLWLMFLVVIHVKNQAAHHMNPLNPLAQMKGV